MFENLNNTIWFVFLGFYLNLFVIVFFIWLGRKNDKEKFYYSLLVICYSLFLVVKVILPIFNSFYNFTILFNIYVILLNFSPGIMCLGFILLINYIFKINKFLNLLKLGFILIFIIVAFCSYIVYMITKDEFISNIIYAPIGFIYGFLYFIYIIYNFFSKKLYKNKYYLYFFISMIFFFIPFLSYPILVILGIDKFIQMLILNSGMLIMCVMIILFYIKKINYDYYNLMDSEKELKIAANEKINMNNDLLKLNKILEQKNVQLEGLNLKLEKKIFIKAFDSYCKLNNLNLEEISILLKVINEIFYKEIAYEYKISESTIKRRVKDIFNKLKIDNKEELILKIKEL